MELFQTARKEVMTIGNCRSTFQATVNYPHNLQLVLKARSQQGTHSALISKREERVGSTMRNSYKLEAPGSIAPDSDIENQLKTTTLDSPETLSSLPHFSTKPHN